MDAPAHRAVFVSHGAPTIVLDGSPAARFLSGLGAALGRPRAIVVATAHWTTRRPAVSAAAWPETIHSHGITAQLDERRGLDHGAWTPLMLMYPDAGIPVASLSVQPREDAAHHVAVGRALAGLAAEDVLVLGSGSATHDLRRFRGQGIDAPPVEDARRFSAWLRRAAEAGDEAAISAVWDAPDALSCHPTTEHLYPFHVAFGAGQGAGELLHHSFAYGILALDAYGFGGARAA
ncbi:MAG: DODA-type extradiol aromatic ring-opening family dioxygenase [Alphaproteobacteria bacterium]